MLIDHIVFFKSLHLHTYFFYFVTLDSFTWVSILAKWMTYFCPHPLFKAEQSWDLVGSEISSSSADRGFEARRILIVLAVGNSSDF